MGRHVTRREKKFKKQDDVFAVKKRTKQRKKRKIIKMQRKRRVQLEKLWDLKPSQVEKINGYVAERLRSIGVTHLRVGITMWWLLSVSHLLPSFLTIWLPLILFLFRDYIYETTNLLPLSQRKRHSTARYDCTTATLYENCETFFFLDDFRL